MQEIRFTVDERPDLDDFAAFWERSWGSPAADREHLARVFARSLCCLCAHDGNELVGFVNVAWDGGAHASIFDTTVDPRYRRQGVGTRLVGLAAEEARHRGAEWLHVDFEPHLLAFYRACGFRHTEAGLLDLTALQ